MNLIRRNNAHYPSQSIWDDFFGKDWLDLSDRAMINRNTPAVNIMEKDDQYGIELAAPGMKKDDFKIEVENDLLTISSEVEDKKEEKEEGYTRREFRFRSFRRSFTLPKMVEGDRITASYKDGILNIVIPKKEEAKQKPSRMIEVG